MHAGPRLARNLPTGVSSRAGEQLDAAVADEHRRRLDSLRVDLRSVLDLGAEEPLVRVDCLVEVADGDAEMMDAAGPHGSDATQQLVLECPNRSDGFRGA